MCRIDWNCTLIENETLSGFPSLMNKPMTIPIYSSSIPFKAPGNQEDGQFLHFYYYQLALNLSSFFGPALWSIQVIQWIQEDPAIRNALVTLSSLNYNILHGELSMSTLGRGQRRIAKCCKQLRIYLSSSDASHDVALARCVIFCAFESLIGSSRGWYHILIKG